MNYKKSGYVIDVIDQKILKKINGGIDGTIELSEFIGMKPKNLINRIKRYQRIGLIEIGKTPQKPKGWKRHFKLSELGKEYIKVYESFNVKLDNLNKNEQTHTKTNRTD